MVIDAFVFEGNQARNVSINALRGAFRFLSGNSPKDAYTITTPTATNGVRGTEFDVAVEPLTGETRVVNFTGITRICRNDDLDIRDPNDPERDLPRCVETQSPCSVSVVRAERGIFEYRDPRDRNRELAWYFNENTQVINEPLAAEPADDDDAAASDADDLAPAADDLKP